MCTSSCASTTRSLTPCLTSQFRGRTGRAEATALNLSIDAERFDSDDARRLVAALDGELGELYTTEHPFGPNLKPEHLANGRGVFLSAREGGRGGGDGHL